MAKQANKKALPKDYQVLGIPELTFGDWVQDNDQWLAPAMKIAGVASMLIPGVGPVIGGALQAGAQGVQAYGQSQDANDSVQAQNLNSRKAAFNQSLAQGIMANGGFINYTGQDHMGPNGGIPIDAQGNPSAISGAETSALVEEGEVAATVDGKPYVFSKKLGTADKANKIQNKYKKRLDINDKISMEAMNRELRALVKENESKQPANRNPKKLLYGDPPYGDIKTSADSTDNYPYVNGRVDYPGYQGYLTWMGQEAKTPTLSQAAGVTPGDYNRGYLSPSHAMRGLSNQMWLDQNYNTIKPTASDYGIGTPNINNIAAQGYFNPSTINPVRQTGAQVVGNPPTGPSREMLRPDFNPIYSGGTLDPITITAQRPSSGTPTNRVPSSGASPIVLPSAQSQRASGIGAINMNPDLTTFAGANVPTPTLGSVANLAQPLDAVQPPAAGGPQMYDPAKAALPGIIGQGIAGVGGNLLAAALYKKPDTVNPGLVNPAMVNYSNERLAARENATLAKRSGLQRLRSTPGSTEAMKAQAGALEAGVSRGLGQQLAQSYQRQEDVNTGRQFQSAAQNAQARSQADMFNTRMLQDFREQQMGYVEGAVGSVQGALSDYNTASRMGDIMSMEAGRSGYQVIIDPATGKTKLVPVPGFWKNKQ